MPWSNRSPGARRLPLCCESVIGFAERRVVISLPLMGIGNVGDQRGPRLPDRLITPHGDRKLRPRPPGGPPRRSHYPSWGSETSGEPVDGQPDGVSLPLMGIGNEVQGHHALGGGPPHYPSWGSETKLSSGLPWLVNVSLPLMGIGNLRLLIDNRAVEKLITPHGDRKPAVTYATLNRCVTLSLPLMGIGNDTAGRQASSSSDSLPLMGIGNKCAVRLDLPVDQSSLPLMGIGNFDELVGCELFELGLITPHGDRKRVGSALPA